MPVSFDRSERKKQDDLKNKQKLIEELNHEREEFEEESKAFLTNPNRSKDVINKINQRIISTIDRLFKAGDWEGSLFLRSMAKPLQQLRDRAVAYAEKDKEVEAVAGMTYDSMPDDMQAVYVVLYQADGTNLVNWVSQLKTLRRYVQSRPVYASSEEAQRSVRAKAVQSVEGYVAVAVKKTDIRGDSDGKPRLDRQQQPLVNLKEGCVDPANIIEFVHMGTHYRLERSKLIPI